MSGKFYVGVWGGDLHQHLADEQRFDTLQKAFEFAAPLIEAGCLCNIFDTDFAAPAEKTDAAMRELLKDTV